MNTPKRIQLRRLKGWRMPENTVKVARTTKWGNPFIVGEDGTRLECVNQYSSLLTGHLCPTAKAPIARQREALEYVRQHIEQLRGHNLACWCPLDQPCHADVLLQLANAPTEPQDDQA
jgi:hypothetical protein